MGLRDKYAYAIQVCKGKLQGNAEERDGKLYFKGTVASEAEKNEIWIAIKTIPDWQKDIVADIQVNAPAAAAVGTSGSGARSYTVQAGDTLGKIAKEQLGNAGSYMKIFDANKDVLSDPDKIKPGQVLRIP
jgi:nucleoid-associated protein YgaU